MQVQDLVQLLSREGLGALPSALAGPGSQSLDSQRMLQKPPIAQVVYEVLPVDRRVGCLQHLQILGLMLCTSSHSLLGLHQPFGIYLLPILLSCTATIILQMHSSLLQLPSNFCASGTPVQCPSSQLQDQQQGQQQLQVILLLSLHLSDSKCSQRRRLLAGLADPGPVAAALWTDAELGSAVCLDSIVTVVDARNIRRQLTEKRPEGAVNEAQQQIAYADVILLNKVMTLIPSSAVFWCCMRIFNGHCSQSWSQ